MAGPPPSPGAFRIDSKPRSFAIAEPRSNRRCCHGAGGISDPGGECRCRGAAQRLRNRAKRAWSMRSCRLRTTLPIALRRQWNKFDLRCRLATDPRPASPPQLRVPSPTPAPPSVTNAPALTAHEVLGFAPYWSLRRQHQFDLSGFTTVDYFSVGVNPDGPVDDSGAGWEVPEPGFFDLVAGRTPPATGW